MLKKRKQNVTKIWNDIKNILRNYAKLEELREKKDKIREKKINDEYYGKKYINKK